MARLLALEWDDSEARLAVAASHGRQPLFEQAFSVDLQPRGRGAKAEVDVAARIASALAARGIGRTDTLVCVGRSSIELRQFTVPPSPEEELPELVRFQAMREFSSLKEEWPLDFLVLNEAPGQPRNVLAAALDPALVEQIRATCTRAGLKPRHLVLRPCAASSLVRRCSAPPAAAVCLLVDLFSDEADLTVMIDGREVFLRTARLPGDPLCDEGAAEALFSEIRRTTVAAQNQLGGRHVQSIILCGRSDTHAALAGLVQEQLDTPTEVFDPFGKLTLARELRAALPDRPGRFAPLLGMLADGLEPVPHTIDFLNPRRRAAPTSRRNAYLLAGMTAVLLVLAALFGVRWQAGRLDDEIRQLQADTKTWETRASKAAGVEKAASEIEAWTSREVIWLDQLHWFCREFPPAQEAMLTQLRLGPSRKGGEMRLDGLARNVDTLKAMEKALHDKGHEVIGKGSSQGSPQAPYSLRFSSSLILGKEAP